MRQRYLPKGRGIPETNNVETTNVHITVNDGEKPIFGATVIIDDVSGTTINGGCNLEDVPTGIQTITVSKKGYIEYSDSITVSPEENDFTITLTEEE